MTATTHAIVGGAIASAIPNPVIGVTLAAISHPLLDMVPHWDLGWGWRKKTKTRLFLESLGDLTLGTLVSYFLFGQNLPFWYWFLAVAVSVGWDVAEAPYWFFKWKFFPFGLIYNFQSKIQGKSKTAWGGIFTQVVTMVVFFFIPLILKS